MIFSLKIKPVLLLFKNFTLICLLASFSGKTLGDWSAGS